MIEKIIIIEIDRTVDSIQTESVKFLWAIAKQFIPYYLSFFS